MSFTTAEARPLRVSGSAAAAAFRAALGPTVAPPPASTTVGSFSAGVGVARADQRGDEGAMFRPRWLKPAALLRALSRNAPPEPLLRRPPESAPSYEAMERNATTPPIELAAFWSQDDQNAARRPSWKGLSPRFA